MLSAVVFVDTQEEADDFDAAQHFNTAPELVDRHFNRPTNDQLKATKMITKNLTKREMNRVEGAKAKAYTELMERTGREQKLKGARKTLDETWSTG